MRIIGCDLHARQQTVAMLDTTTGEVEKQTLRHEGSETREFYSAAGGQPFHLRRTSKTFRVPHLLRRLQKVRVLTLPLDPFPLCSLESRQVPLFRFCKDPNSN